MLKLILPLAAVLLSVAVVNAAPTGQSSPVARCVNMGNMLEAPNEGEWGLSIEQEYFGIIAEAGFDTVRIPINWAAHADQAAPYTIDPVFLARIDEVVGWALDADLAVIVNIHHYGEIMADPDGHLPRLLGLWRQIAAHYADYPSTVIFELLNEPNVALTPERWNTLFPQVLSVVRETNPERTVIVGGGEWNSLNGLMGLELPDDDHLLATFHYYEPFPFTHQGAEWAAEMDQYLGTEWGSTVERLELAAQLRSAAAWGEENDIPVLLGEFGAYGRADMDSRARWTSAVREAAEDAGMGWCYWEFAAGFGFYDRATGAFSPIYEALIPPEE